MIMDLYTSSFDLVDVFNAEFLPGSSKLRDFDYLNIEKSDYQYSVQIRYSRNSRSFDSLFDSKNLELLGQTIGHKQNTQIH